MGAFRGALFAALFFDPLLAMSATDVRADARRSLLQGDWPRVAQAAARWKQEEPTSAVAQWLIAYASLATGRYNHATTAFSRLDRATPVQQLSDFASSLLDEDPKSAPAHMLKGDALARMGDHLAAIASLSRALDLEPASALIHDVRGVVSALAGQTAEAIRDLEKAIELDPQFADAHANLASVQSKGGNPVQATEHFTRAIQLVPDFALAYNGRGAAYAKLGDLDAALGDFTAATNISPEFAPARANLREADGANAATRSSVGAARGPPLGTSIRTVFDQQGRLTKAAYPDGSEIEYVLDPKGNVATILDSRLGTTHYEYNHLHQLASVTYPNARRFSFEYDAAGRLSGIAYPDGQKTGLVYDSQRRTIIVRDAEREIQRVFDASGRLTQLTMPSGGTTTFDYDMRGGLSTITDESGAMLNDLELKFRYFDDGRLTAVESPLGAQSYRYDATGRLREVELSPGLKAFHDELPDGAVMVTSPLGYQRFDATGKPVASMTVDGLKETLEWNAQGQLLRRGNPLVGVTEYDWSSRPQTARVTLASGLAYDLRVDTDGRLQTLDIGGREFRVGYDSMGNADRVVGPRERRFAELRYHYDPAGRVDQVTIPNWGRYGHMVEAMLEFGANHPVPSQEWLERYDRAWAEGRGSTQPVALDRMVHEFEGWPQEVMEVQANVFALTFLTMIARPASVVLDWVSKPFGASVALTTAKQGVRALTDHGLRNLSQIPDAEDVVAGFERADRSLKWVEEKSQWGSLAWKVTKLVASGVEVRRDWRFGNPPALEASGQQTWIHDVMKPHVNGQIVWEGAKKEGAKEGFKTLVVKPLAKNAFDSVLAPEGQVFHPTGPPKQDWRLLNEAIVGGGRLLPIPTKEYQLARTGNSELAHGLPGSPPVGGVSLALRNNYLIDASGEMELLVAEAIAARPSAARKVWDVQVEGKKYKARAVRIP